MSMKRIELADAINKVGSDLQTISTYIKEKKDKRARLMSIRRLDSSGDSEELLRDYLDDNFEEES